jgi:hypothetical protein
MFVLPSEDCTFITFEPLVSGGPSVAQSTRLGAGRSCGVSRKSCGATYDGFPSPAALGTSPQADKAFSRFYLTQREVRRNVPEMSNPARNQELRTAVLALIVGQVKSSPRQDQFRHSTKEPTKLSGIGKVTVPESVWQSLVDAPELAAFAISFNHDQGTAPEFMLERR